jgi:hypothetical protein
MEKAVRALPGLFDDPFVLAGSYTQYVGETQTTVPPRRVCDEAAKTFTEVVPDAPRFAGSTAEEEQRSIDKMREWWKNNGENLIWDAKRGVLVLGTETPALGADQEAKNRSGQTEQQEGTER